jgi:DNA modification methylase
MWKAKGIKSEESREEVKTYSNSFANEKYGRSASDSMAEVSIFDPALCELMYRWYAPEGGTILDPFAGGSVRGIVAGYLGYQYTGIDIRIEQVLANRRQAEEILTGKTPAIWHDGDSNELLDVLAAMGHEYDVVFSCPPYADLEVYSELPGDISNMEYVDFLRLYRSIIHKSVALLKSGGFAIFVVGDMRDKQGYYRDFVSHTKQAFIAAGALLWNEAILLQPIGTAMLRANNTFLRGNKKLVKVHENVLIFHKP